MKVRGGTERGEKTVRREEGSKSHHSRVLPLFPPESGQQHTLLLCNGSVTNWAGGLTI